MQTCVYTACASHILQGTTADPGLYTHSIAKILDIAKRCKTFKYTVNISVMEIYCNDLRDLLCPVQQKHVIKNGKNGIHVPGLTYRSVDNVDDAKKVSGLLDILYVSSILYS